MYVCVRVLKDRFLIQQEVHASTGLRGRLGGSPIVWKLNMVYKYKIGQEGNVQIHRSFIIHDAFLSIHDYKQTFLLHMAEIQQMLAAFITVNGHNIVFGQSYAKLLLHDHCACFHLIFTRGH